jgi:hypothetical protein
MPVPPAAVDGGNPGATPRGSSARSRAMKTTGETARALALFAALAASVGGCKGRSTAGQAPQTPGLRVWEPIDEGFKGCEGG